MIGRLRAVRTGATLYAAERKRWEKWKMRRSGRRATMLRKSILAIRGRALTSNALGVAFSIALLGGITPVWSQSKQIERLERSADVFREIMDTPDRGIPSELLERAACVGIIPSVKKFALGFGGRHGAGFVICRSNQGKGPLEGLSGFSMSGGSFGLQLGFSATDYVLLFMNTVGMEKLLQDKFTLGGDASVAAGPVGRTAAAATDAQLHAKILGYSRSKGLFAGLALEGAVLRPSSDDNEKLYGHEVSAKELLIDGTIPAPAAAQPLLSTLAGHRPVQVTEASAARKEANSSLSGQVRDGTGAVIPDAQVSIVNAEAGTSRTISTDETGQYKASELQPGSYEVRAAAPGLGDAAPHQVVLRAGAAAAVDLTIRAE
jgi:SH3 domain-containing YSC84-like protein 1